MHLHDAVLPAHLVGVVPFEGVPPPSPHPPSTGSHHPHVVRLQHSHHELGEIRQDLPPLQVWSQSSFEVSCQLLTKDLNQV